MRPPTPHSAALEAALPTRLVRAVALVLVLAGGLLHASPYHVAAMRALNGLASTWPEAVWSQLTLLAFGWAALVLVSVADRGVEGARAVLLAFLVGGGTGQVLKHLLQQPRPGVVLEGLHMIGTPVLNWASMPSGHALAALSIATLWVCLLRQRGQARWLQTAVWVLGALMAFSRVAVGAHWPADVLVGAGLGVWIGHQAWQWQSRWWRHGAAMSWAVPVVLELTGAWFAFASHEGYPQAQWLQWGLGGLALLSAVQRTQSQWCRRGHRV